MRRDAADPERAVGDLPAPFRIVFTLREMEGLSSARWRACWPELS
jgi:DNA-directed RNA polymerase specialized sigma24 family protein